MQRVPKLVLFFSSITFGIFPSFLESSTIFRFFFFICIKIGYVSGGEIDSVLPNIPKKSPTLTTLSERFVANDKNASDQPEVSDIRL